MSIFPIAFLDLSAFTSTFVRSYRDKLKDDDLGWQTLLLRGAESDAPILKEWASARKLLLRMRNEAAAHMGGRQPLLGKAFVASLKPQAFTPWRHDDDPYTQNHIRTVTCMIPSPGAWVYSGGAAKNLMVGEVHVVGQSDLHSEVNLGLCPCVWLVADLKRPDED